MVKGDVTGKLLDLLFIPVILHVMTEQDITDRIDGLKSLGNNGKQCNDTGYLIDTHTGVAAAVYEQYKKKTGDMTKTVIASTASPYKFSRSVMEAVLGKKEDADEFALIDEMERISGVKIPQAIEEIRKAEIRHNRQCKPEEMEKTVSEILQ